MIWLGLTMLAAGALAALYLGGVMPGPTLRVGESTGFMLLVGSVLVAVSGLAIAVVGLLW